MKQEFIQKIIQNSDAYTQQLWNRFQNNLSTSEEEASVFTHIKASEPQINLQNILDLSHLFPNSSLASLPLSFFNPGATGDIFINYHTQSLNGFVHSHDFFEIIYVCKGNVLDWVDGTEISLNQGELCIHNPKAQHKIIKMIEGEDFLINILLPQSIFQRSFYHMLMQNRELNQFFHNFMISSDSTSNFMVFHNTSYRIDTIIELLVDEFLRKESASCLVLESTLIVLFSELLRDYQSDPFSQNLVNYISEHLQDINMEQASLHFGYHKNYFPNIVKQHTGYTFGKLVTTIRLQSAMNLLLFTDKSLEEISSSIGYQSTASFYNHFKSSYHMTPNEYRQKHTFPI